MQQNPYGAPQGNMGAPAPTGGQLSTGRHEFGAVEDQAMRQAGKRTRMWGVVSLVLGALTVLGAIIISVLGVALPGPMAGGMVAGAVLGTSGLIQLSTGYFYVQSGSRIESVADTQGNDVEHLMQGLDKLGNAMRIESIVTIVLTLVGFVAGIVLAGFAS